MINFIKYDNILINSMNINDVKELDSEVKFIKSRKEVIMIKTKSFHF